MVSSTDDGTDDEICGSTMSKLSLSIGANEPVVLCGAEPGLSLLVVHLVHDRVQEHGGVQPQVQFLGRCNSTGKMF